MNSDIDAKDLVRMMREFMQSKTLFTAHELGIFDKLSNGGQTAGQVAQQVNASERGTRTICNTLSAMGVLIKEGDKYFLPDNLRGFLLQNGENSFRNLMELLHDFWYIWSDLTKVIKDGKPIITMNELSVTDEARLKTFARGMHERSKEPSRVIIKAIDISSRRRMLDLGGGAGTYSLEWAKRYPLLRAMVLDQPKVLEVTKEYIKKYDLEDRVSCIPGDFIQMGLEKLNYDLILLANILQMFSPEENLKILKKVYDSLETNGMIMVHGYTLDDKEYRPLSSALFGLSIISVTPGGDAYKRSDKMKWLKEVGFRNIRFYEIDAVPTTVLTALK